MTDSHLAAVRGLAHALPFYAVAALLLIAFLFAGGHPGLQGFLLLAGLTVAGAGFLLRIVFPASGG